MTISRMTALLGVVAVATLAAAEGTATGTFTVKGKATNLTHAYALSKPDPSDTTKTKQEIQVILSDVALTPKVLDDPTPFGLQDLTRANQLHGLVFFVDASTKAVTGTMMYDYAAFKMSNVSVAGTNIKLDVQTLTPTTIAGKIYTAKAGDFNDVPYEYAVTFSAPITPKK